MYGHLNNSFISDFEPSEFYLSQNHPNPFRDKTTIKYCVAFRTRVILTVYDVEGNEIEKLVDEEQNPGTYEVEFFASACHSHESGDLKEGTYCYHFEAGDYKIVKEMQLLK
jgi:hypothetical protein